MRFEASQNLRLSQQQKLAPRMIQSMEILQLSTQALEERLETELASNPTLELTEPTDRDERALAQQHEQDVRDETERERGLDVGENGSGSSDFERLANLSSEYGESWENTYESASTNQTADGYANKPEDFKNDFRGSSRFQGERDTKMDAMANTACREESLTEQLLNQWRVIEVAPDLHLAGEFLIGFIDGDGYLRAERELLLRERPMEVTEEHLEEAIYLLQTELEPPGLAARDLQECLLLQIDASLERMREEAEEKDLDLDLDYEDEIALLEIVTRIVQHHLKDVEANRLPKVAEKLGLTLDEVKLALSRLRRFKPRPGRELISGSPQRIFPDAIVSYDDSSDQYIAMLADDKVAQLQLNRNYQKMAKDKAVDKKTRDFVGNNLRQASWLIDAVAQRQNTLLRVVNVVVAAQREFFDLGPQALKPLPMTQVADQLGIHVATVSRAVNEKFIETPRGIFPLRMFFSGGTETGKGEAMSWSAVQAKLQEIVDGEDKQKPLSDDALVEKLKEAGIEIARRTVAKYRKQLNIPTARQRREY